ncbi:MAG TPA: c-type cytochrome [Cytophagales bacterium]|nr:c-type cytochrome [Cytophagales bacterium]
MFLNNYKIFKRLSLVTVLFLSISTYFGAIAEDTPLGDAAKGQELFSNNCASCHNVHKVMVGPALKGITQRRSVEWIIPWVKNPAKVIASGDPYAKKLAADYQSAGIMTGFGALKDDDIKNILAYVKQEEAKPPVEAGGGQDDAKKGPVKTDNSFLNIVLAGFIIVLVAMLIALISVMSILRKYAAQNAATLSDENRYLVEEKSDWKSITQSTGFRFTVAFIVLGLIGKTTIDALTNIGIQQGYAPKQPIAFSHKLHAGKYKIDCNYCHTGVRIGKQANIPSANICLNCHSQIKTNSEEIKKIFASADYDPAKKTYGPNPRPIEWVRVHNLPDLAYFNHAQHVKVAGLECQKCHGPIQEMEVVQQYAPLTMGWCINCHRETVVKAEGNKYYDNLLKLHNKISSDPMKVKDIGGLECSKCHY